MPGDTIWLANKRNYNGKGFQIVAEIIPNNSFVMVGGDDFNRIKRGDKAIGSWSIYLYPEDAGVDVANRTIVQRRAIRDTSIALHHF